MSRVSILVLAPDATPESICRPLLSFRQAEGFARLHGVSLIIRSPGEEAVRTCMTR
jgi:hypothetical protein